MKKKPLFNPNGDIDLGLRRMIEGNTTNLNDFNNMKYKWVSNWYRQAMNNFWIPEEVNLSTDVKDYRLLPPAERRAYDKILSFLIFLDSIQTANLPNISQHVTANEVNLCLSIQTFHEAVHSQSYSYKAMVQAAGRIDRLNTAFHDLYYFYFTSNSKIDLAMRRALKNKKNLLEQLTKKLLD